MEPRGFLHMDADLEAPPKVLPLHDPPPFTRDRVTSEHTRQQGPPRARLRLWSTRAGRERIIGLVQQSQSYSKAIMGTD